ncbi:MAG: hypothetical protein IT336_15090 [Thermomicrobiales bacterium]|nr:hypothetical protein [Thermomicrobiales bacterium]
MNIEPMTRAWRSLPLPYQAAIAVAILFGLLVVAGGAAGVVSRYKDRRFDAAEAERAKERATWAAERDEHLRRAEAAEAKAVVLEAQLAAQKQLLAGAGKAIAAKDKAVQEVVDAYSREIDSVDASGQSPAERAADVRRRLRELGYLPE